MDDGQRWYAEVGQQQEYEFHARATALDSRDSPQLEKHMGLIAADTGSTFKAVPPGVFVGRAYRVIDLGTQEEEYLGDKKLQRKVMIVWELFGEDEDGGSLVTDDGLPLTINKTYTLSLGKKANLRADLEAWRGKPFSDDELKGFDICNLLGAYCMLNVIHKTSQAGKTYSNIKSISPLPSALRANKPAPVHKNESFILSAPDMAMFETFYEKLQEKIKASTEWRTMFADQQPATAGGDPFDDDSEIPFMNPYFGRHSYVV